MSCQPKNSKRGHALPDDVFVGNVENKVAFYNM